VDGRKRLYSEAEEHSSCGVGLVVSIDGKPSRKVVENGINALKAVWHRGAVDADGKTGDGAGIHVQIPPAFFYDQVVRTGHEPRKDELMAVGQVFLPRTDFGAQETCRTIVESEVLRMGYYIYGWRHVPVDVGASAKRPTRPGPRSSRSSSPIPRAWTRRPSSASFTSSAAGSRRPPPPSVSRSCTSVRCPAGRSSTRA
jgi:glutamate synthase domain-containing protein 1